ncbi:MAG: SapC family protein [Alphaproteobacteria bacterium]
MIFKQVVPISWERHKGKKVKRIASFAFAGEEIITPVVAAEFPRAAANYPVVFLKDKEGRTGSVAQLGLAKGKNLFIDGEGRWRAAYIPAAIRRYPFTFAKTDQEGKLVVCIDEGSGLISEEEGEPIYTDDGKPSESFAKIIEFLKQFQGQQVATEALCATLNEHEMLKPLQAQVKSMSGKTYGLKGFLAVDEKKLSELPDGEFIEWRKKGFLTLIYAHLASLGQMALLVQRLEDAGGIPPQAPPPAPDDPVGPIIH